MISRLPIQYVVGWIHDACEYLFYVFFWFDKSLHSTKNVWENRNKAYMIQYRNTLNRDVIYELILEMKTNTNYLYNRGIFSVSKFRIIFNQDIAFPTSEYIADFKVLSASQTVDGFKFLIDELLSMRYKLIKFIFSEPSVGEEKSILHFDIIGCDFKHFNWIWSEY